MAPDASSAPDPHPPGETGIQATPEPFLTGKLFPTEEPAAFASQAPAAPVRARSQVLTHVVLPLGILLAAVAGLAWVSQFRWRNPGKDGALPAAAQAEPTIEFKRYDPEVLDVIRAIWDTKQLLDPKTKEPLSNWLAEYEVFGKGYYDFEFSNPTNTPADLSVSFRNCFCTSLEACLVPADKWNAYEKSRDQALKEVATTPPADDLSWHKLEPKAQVPLLVPPGTRGVLRMHWERKAEPGPLGLSVQTEARPAGKRDANPVTETLVARVALVPPVLYHPQDVDLGTIRPGKASVPGVFYAWSPTRDLQVKDLNQDPCFELAIEKLEPKELEKLSQELASQGMFFRIRSAFRVRVQVHESKAGKQLDQGIFKRTAAIQVAGSGEPLKEEAPTLRGLVLGDVRVVYPTGEGTRIPLGTFKKNEGSRFKAVLATPPGLELETDQDKLKYEPASLGLTLQLKKLEEPGEGGKVEWELRIHAKPLVEGPIPDHAAVILSIKGSTRKVRLPISGNAGRG